MTTILTIQSHVAAGHVGNRSATFAIERFGCEAISVNTVQFSNHTGYGAWTGKVCPPDEIAEVVRGVFALGALARCDGVISGYQGGAAVGRVILGAVDRVRAGTPDALYCCDPVMGDDGRGVFVHAEIPDHLRGQVVPHADIITPNRFELALLTGRPVTTVAETIAAAAAARALGPSLVLVTSVPVAPVAGQARIAMLLDRADGSWIADAPQLPVSPAPNGAGDCVAALFLAHLLCHRDPVAALGHVTAALFDVFAATHRAGTRELQLIAAQDALVTPSTTITPVRLR